MSVERPERPSSGGNGPRSPEVERLCRQFASQCDSGQHPRIESYLERAGSSWREELLAGLLEVEMHAQRRNGEEISQGSYLRRFPNHTAIVRQAVAAVDFAFSGTASQSRLSAGSGMNRQDAPSAPEQDRTADTAPVDGGTLDFSDDAAEPPIPVESDSAALDHGQRSVAIQGEYRLIRLLGSGQAGEVWLAEAPGGREVALKIVRLNTGHSISERERRSLELIKNLHHAFLISVHNYWSEQDQLYIAMDRADSSLEDELKKYQRSGQAGVPIEELLSYMRESAEALDYLHGQNLAHRDVKPANILLLGGHAKLGDFGLARILMRDDVGLMATTAGTLAFMAPEVFHRKISPKSDQFSLARTYLFLRTGELSPTEQKRLAKRLGITKRERRVVDKALSENPDDRYDNCSAWYQDLRAAIERKPRQKWPYVLRGVALIACLAALFYFQLLRLSLPSEGTVEAGSQWKVPVSSPLLSDAFLNAAADEGNLTAEVVGGDVSGEAKSEGQGPRTAETGVTQCAIYPASEGPPELVVDADLQAAAGVDCTVAIRLNRGWLTIREQTRIQIESPQMQVPEGCTPTESARRVRCKTGAIAWSHLLREVPGCDTADCPQVELVLIDVAAPFYIMRNKVSNELFALFAKSELGRKHAGTQWQQGGVRFDGTQDIRLPAHDHPKHPVFNVSTNEAHHFATWLGGELPSPEQWDTAAGKFASSNRPGPFTGDGEHVAVRREKVGPRQIGAIQADGDELPLRDMAGNGEEWTSAVRKGGEAVRLPLEEPVRSMATVIVRGQSYMAERPYYYDDPSAGLRFGERYPTTSFRVVIPLPGHDQ